MTETRPQSRHVRLLIVGSGPAGYTAAVYGARAMLDPLLIQGIQPGGQLTITTDVENWPGDASVLGPDLMVRMEAHARETGAEIVSDHVSSIDLSARPFRAALDSGGAVNRRRRDPRHRGAGQVARPAHPRRRSRASASPPARRATGSSTAGRRSS